MELSTLRLWLYTVMKVRAERFMRIEGSAAFMKHAKH
jgi:cytidylate kinase